MQMFASDNDYIRFAQCLNIYIWIAAFQFKHFLQMMIYSTSWICWKKHQVNENKLSLKIIKKFGLPTFLVTLPCTGLWILNYNNTVEKMVGIISNLNENDLLASKEIQSLNYSDRTRILNSNPVLIRYFQYRVEVLFKEIIVEIEKICHKSSVSSQRRSTYSFANMGNWCTSFFKVSNKHEHINFDDCTAESI